MERYNSWIDIPVVETIEYFTSVLVNALSWAQKYAILFGLVGIIWSGFKVVMSRMTVKDLWWDTLFKWVCFLLLMTMYTPIVQGFLGIATEIGEKAGVGKIAVEQGMKDLYKRVQGSLSYNAELISEVTRDIADRTGVKIESKFSALDSYNEYMDKIQHEVGVVRFNSENDRKKAQQIVDAAKDKMGDDDLCAFSALSLSVLNSVCKEVRLNGDDADSLLDTYVQLQIYLTDSQGNDTCFISPAAMMRLSVLCGAVMFDKWRAAFTREGDAIGDGISNIPAKLGHLASAIPQVVELIFCMLVLVIAIGFAMIQYVMTIIEYVIVTAIAAIFLPLMLFDGTKDIPKKFIPVMISFMIKIIVMLICMYFVIYLLITHTINTITDSMGINLFTVAEVFFIAALSYILTQNAPKIAQTILTGQPQLSMGEALQGAGTAAMTAVTMKQTPHAATMAAAKTKAAMNTASGTIRKNNAAAKAAVASLGENATARQKFKAAALARGATATQDLKDRMRAKFEAAGKEQGTGFGIVDKAAQMAGLQKPVGAGGGGTDGGSSAYGVTGQFARGADGKTMSYSTRSNPDFRTATKYDPATKSQRSMTNDEFQQEKSEQGKRIGDFIGQQMSRKIEAQKQKKAGQDEQNGVLPDSLSGNERAFDR